MGRVKKWFQDKIGIGENRDHIAEIEQKIRFNSLLINNLLPDIYNVDLKKHPIRVLKEQKLEDTISLSVHKNDLMLLIHLYKNGDFNKSLNAYYRLGHQTALLLQDVLKEHSIQNAKSFLDFGSGYGRVTRFLPFALGKDIEVFTSEVKSEAVAFNENELGFKSIHHGSQAESFPTDRQFDVIFAGSIFSHLPEKMLEEWLAKLTEVLSPNGLFLFTTHNTTLDKSLDNSIDIHYTTNSEDAVLNMVSDHLSDTSEYGTTYISDKKIDQLMGDLNLSHATKHKAFGNLQDVVVARRKEYKG